MRSLQFHGGIEYFHIHNYQLLFTVVSAAREDLRIYIEKKNLAHFLAIRLDRKVLQKNKIIRIKFLGRWGLIEARATSRNRDI